MIDPDSQPSPQANSAPNTTEIPQPPEEQGADKTGDTNDQGTAPVWETKPKKGDVTADDKNRFLSEIVANHGLQKVGDKIAAAVKDTEPGDILIVDDLSWSVSDIFYLDIRQKLEALLRLTAEATQKCRETAGEQREPEDLLDRINVTLEKLHPGEARLFSVSGLVGALGAAGALISKDTAGIAEGIKAVGDIIGYFRSDYDIKGQTLTNVDDFYIQALVAGKLQKMKRGVYLLNFNFIERSKLIEDLGKLFEQKHQMLTCAEKIKSQFVSGNEARLTALETHLASLRAKLIEYLVKADEDIVETLKKEIDLTAALLIELLKRNIPNSQITALETYLSTLRTKLADELVKDISGARATVEAEIKKIEQRLKDKDDPAKKLTDTEVQSLIHQRELYQAQLATIVVSEKNKSKENLRNEIEQVTAKLKEIQATRCPDSQITAVETHLAALRAKLVECLAKNENDAVESLEEEIAATTQMIGSIQKELQPAKGIVSSSTKVSEAVDAFFTTITAVPAGGTLSPLVAACIRESLREKEIRYILKIKMISSGADFIIEKPPFFVRNLRTSYLGGGVVSYVMAEKDGRIVASETVGDVAALDFKLGRDPSPLKWEFRPDSD